MLFSQGSLLPLGRVDDWFFYVWDFPDALHNTPQASTVKDIIDENMEIILQAVLPFWYFLSC